METEGSSFWNKCLARLVKQSEGPRSTEEMFDGSQLEDFKKGMEAHFELFEITKDREKMLWFVSGMTNPVITIWSKNALWTGF